MNSVRRTDDEILCCRGLELTHPHLPGTFERIGTVDGVFIRCSLQVLSTVNAVHLRVTTLQRESFDKTNPEHVALLESLWSCLKPGSSRKDWGELGFQNGSAPQSDFRGMGMLGESYFLTELPKIHFVRSILMEDCSFQSGSHRTCYRSVRHQPFRYHATHLSCAANVLSWSP